MTMRTPTAARTCFCPVNPVEQCAADACILWRWEPLLASEPGYKDALIKAGNMPKAERGGLLPAEYVNANRAAFDLPERPYQGWCGLGERPEVRLMPKEKAQ